MKYKDSRLLFEQSNLLDNDLKIFEKKSVGYTVRKYRNISKTVGLSIEFDEKFYKDAIKIAKTYLRREIVGNKILVVGVGNSNMTADSLGSSVVDRINTLSNKIMTLKPEVTGVTGIESNVIIKSVVECIAPTTVIMVDSLCASSYLRVGRVVQICTDKFCPGSAVGGNVIYTSDTLNTKLISIGIPVVVTVEGILMGKSGSKYDNLIVAPKNIDQVIDKSTVVITEILNSSLNNMR